LENPPFFLIRDVPLVHLILATVDIGICSTTATTEGLLPIAIAIAIPIPTQTWCASSYSIKSGEALLNLNLNYEVDESQPQRACASSQGGNYPEALKARHSKTQGANRKRDTEKSREKAPKGQNSKARGASPGNGKAWNQPCKGGTAACVALAGLIVYPISQPRVPEPAVARSSTLGCSVPRYLY
jgi:hypothetical protein